MSRRLDELAPVFRPLANDFLARLAEAQIVVLITCTGRTAAEQAIAVAAGNSKVSRSKHQDGLAMDVVPYTIYDANGPDKLNWNTLDPIWLKIGAIAKAVGLRWGGDFQPVNAIGVGWDPGHVEYVAPAAEPPNQRV